MLVLARRLNERIVLPGIRTTIRIVSLRPSLVRLGFEAPPGVAVLREEVFWKAGAAPPGPEVTALARPAPLDDALRKRLDTITGGLALLRGQIRASGGDRLLGLLDRVESELEAFERQLEEVLAGEDGALAPPVPAGP
jgi:carbon storage regulator CsrA